MEECESVQQAMRFDPPENGKGGGKLDGHLWREFPINARALAFATVATERSTDNGTLMFDSTTGSLLGDFLGDTLLVHSPIEDGPADFSGVLALEEKGFGFRSVETENFAVSTDE